MHDRRSCSACALCAGVHSTVPSVKECGNGRGTALKKSSGYSTCTIILSDFLDLDNCFANDRHLRRSGKEVQLDHINMKSGSVEVVQKLSNGAEDRIVTIP